MSSTLRALVGASFEAVSHDNDSNEWVFQFTGGHSVRAAAPWRILDQGRIAIGWEDDGQQFGLNAPVVLVDVVRSLVGAMPVTEASVSESTGDLAVTFGPRTRLDVFNASSGYEGWVLHCPDGRWVVGQGRGNVVESGPGGA